MSTAVLEQVSLFCFQIQNRRFNDETIRILECTLAKNVRSTLEFGIVLKDFMRHESLCVIREIAGKSIDHKLVIADFFVRAFALIGDIESCLALRYEALIMRDQKAAGDIRLMVLQSEWLGFAQQAIDHGFYFVARKACERALLCAPLSSVPDHENHDQFDCVDVTEEIRKLYDAATILASSQSVLVHAAEHMRKKTVQQLRGQAAVRMEKPPSGSTLYRNGIKKRNERKLREHQCLLQVTSHTMLTNPVFPKWTSNKGECDERSTQSMPIRLDCYGRRGHVGSGPTTDFGTELFRLCKRNQAGNLINSFPA